MNCLKRRPPSPNRFRRGTLLAAYFMLIPAAMSAFLLILTRLDIANYETRRQQDRTQARLLAESALAMYYASNATNATQSSADPEPISGAIEGIGDYEFDPQNHGAPTGRVCGAQRETTCEIVIDWQSDPSTQEPTPHLAGYRYRVIPTVAQP